MIHFGEIYRLISFDLFINNLGLKLDHKNILDIGFNKGIYRWYFLNKFSSVQYSGVEIDDNYLGLFNNTTFHNFEENRLDQIFDFIFCSHVLEHINNDYNFLNNVKNSLEGQSGRLVIRVPIPTDNHIYFRKYNSRYHEHDEHARNGYFQSDIEKLLKKAGYDIKNSFTYMGSLGLAVHTFFELVRDHGLRLQRILQIPYIIISLIDLYIFDKKVPSDLIVLATPKRER